MIQQPQDLQTTDLDTSFTSLPLREELLKSLTHLHYETMTPVQMQTLPLILCNVDVIAQSKTGSGKTAAFGLSLLNQLKVERYGIQALVLCPTRELAEQVCQSLRRLACFIPNVKILNLSGGIPMRPQTNSLQHGAHIIVGTPGRILKHLNKDSLSFEKLATLVLDEADRMLDMGFMDDIKAIISRCAKKRQTILFSATYSTEIKQLAQQFMQQPREVSIETNLEISDIEQKFYELSSPRDKLSALKKILLHLRSSPTLIFCNTKQQTTELTKLLSSQGFSALALHGDLEQVERDLAILRFANQSCSILVATDVAARGLDIKELGAVINFDMAFEPDIHTHRIGRTGRAGQTGIAYNLSTPSDAQRICNIEESLKQPIQWSCITELDNLEESITPPKMVTLCLAAGKKEKIRAGDILGALTKDAGLEGDQIGKINITMFNAYVAIHQSKVKQALNYLQKGKIKGQKIEVRKLS